MYPDNDDNEKMMFSLKILRGVDLIPKGKKLLKLFSSSKTTADPYCLIYVNGKNISRTPVRFKTLYPIWGGSMSTCHFAGGLDTEVRIEIYDYVHLKHDKIMGCVCFKVEDLLLMSEEEYPNVWRDVESMNGCDCSGQLELRLQCVAPEEGETDEHNEEGNVTVGGMEYMSVEVATTSFTSKTVQVTATPTKPKQRKRAPPYEKANAGMAGVETSVEVAPSISDSSTSLTNTSVKVTTTPTKLSQRKKATKPALFVQTKHTKYQNIVTPAPKLSPGPNLRSHSRKQIKQMARCAIAPVTLHVYDVFDTTTTRRLNNVGLATGYGGIFHSGIEVYGKEYSFGGSKANRTGVFSLRPTKCPIYRYRKSIYLGDCKLSPTQVSSIVKKMKPEWMAPTYDFLRKNCVFFSKEFAIELGVGTIPEWVYSLAKVGAGLDDLRRQSKKKKQKKKKNGGLEEESKDGGIPQYESTSDSSGDSIEDILEEMGMEIGLQHSIVQRHLSSSLYDDREMEDSSTNDEDDDDDLLPEEMGMEMAYSESEALLTEQVQSVRRIQSFCRFSTSRSEELLSASCSRSRSMEDDAMAVAAELKHQQHEQEHYFPDDDILPDEMGTELNINGVLQARAESSIITGNPTASAAFRSSLLRTNRSRSKDSHKSTVEEEKQEEKEQHPEDETLPAEADMELFMDGVLDSIMAVKVQSAFRGSLARRQHSGGNGGLPISPSSLSKRSGNGCGLLTTSTFDNAYGEIRLAKKISAIMEEDEIKHLESCSPEGKTCDDNLVDVGLHFEGGKVEIELLD